MQNEMGNIHFHNGLLCMETISEWGSLPGYTILVLDDLMMEAADSSEFFLINVCGIASSTKYSYSHPAK
jgi:hypothetical protein